MKEIKQLTDIELKERLHALAGLKEAENLRKQIEEELAAREDKKCEDEKEADKALLRKQRDILGKYYQVDNKFYKVVGVMTDNVFLEYSVCTSDVSKAKFKTKTKFKTYTTIQIDTLLKEGKEITKEVYAANKTNVNQTIDDVTNSLCDTFYASRDMFDEFSRYLKDWKRFWF